MIYMGVAKSHSLAESENETVAMQSDARAQAWI